MTLTEMREYKRATTLLEKLAEVRHLLLVFFIVIKPEHLGLSQVGSSSSKLVYFDLQKKPSDPDVFRLLGEVKYELKDYEGSVLAYKTADRVSKP